MCCGSGGPSLISPGLSWSVSTSFDTSTPLPPSAPSVIRGSVPMKMPGANLKTPMPIASPTSPKQELGVGVRPRRSRGDVNHPMPVEAPQPLAATVSADPRKNLPQLSSEKLPETI